MFLAPRNLVDQKQQIDQQSTCSSVKQEGRFESSTICTSVVCVLDLLEGSLFAIKVETAIHSSFQRACTNIRCFSLGLTRRISPAGSTYYYLIQCFLPSG
ncbi:MAG: hypothetical protein FRX48_01893 [Lasallia pustulata]|uniref:Uncharacterized protein n=1 Tax=Lasallia pustulata TaxID=136370 RepID=A0A5M8PZD6_9LECA|nr:MAG: hypothetical protein FRX48_01893 [Lasallia pustulata]